MQKIYKYQFVNHKARVTSAKIKKILQQQQTAKDRYVLGKKANRKRSDG